MERKSQMYLSAVIMYAIAGFAGYIYSVSNYWFVFVLSLLVALLTASSVIFDGSELRSETKFDWISVATFFVLETALTICVEVVKLPLVGIVGNLNLFVQGTGLVFLMVSVIRFTLMYTKIHVSIKNGIANRKATTKMNVVTENVTNEEIAIKVEETITSEEVKEELVEAQEEVYDFSENEVSEPEVIGIELKEEAEIVTPYMEEEM